MKKAKQPNNQTEKTRKQSSTRRLRRFEKFRKTQNTTSIYFLLWAIFTAISLMLVLTTAVTQRVVLTQTYRGEAYREVTEKGKKIEQDIVSGVPDWAGGSFSGYVRMLSLAYDVRLYILDEKGEVLFPQEPNFDPDAPEVEEQLDFSEEIGELLSRLEQSKNGYAVYEGDGVCVYASEVELYKGVSSYLYVGKSVGLIETVSARMNTRILLLSIFVFMLSFAVTSAVSGWFTNPITEMTKKARRLAQGNFDVDFHGANYGKEMVELAEALNFARDELSKTDRMQKDLIANVSHDFKTPLTMIKGYASMIMEISGDIPEKRNKHAQVIVDEADRLTSLVNDVLDLSKISSGIEGMQVETFDMSAYLYEVMGRFDYLKETQGYRFVTEIEEGMYTRGDKVKLGQVLYNLIGNAVNYTGEDKTVYIRLKKEEGVVRFAVTDTGKGIKEEERSEIWNRYYRSKETHKRPVRGTGLGLSIVKTILERHGFAFGVDSEVGKGSTFYVLFPFEEE